jgi:acetolactate synthase-1/2/3 large subunit
MPDESVTPPPLPTTSLGEPMEMAAAGLPADPDGRLPEPTQVPPAAATEPEIAPAPPVTEGGGNGPSAAERRGPVPTLRVGTRQRTVARYLVQSLRALGVRSAFTVPGESFLSLLEALAEERIRIVTARHEGGAAFMAEATGQLTGRPAAVLATRAVGAANLAIGLQTAREDSTPLIAIVGQVVRPFRGRDAFQEADLAGSIGRLAKWAAEVDEPAKLPELLSRAFAEALTGRPGPVLLAVPEDLLDEAVDPGLPLPAVPRPGGERPDPVAVRRIVHLIADARRPAILAGGGVLRARASDELLTFARLLRVPVIAAWRRGDVVPNDDPHYLGMTGLGAPDSVRRRLEEADALLVLGCRLGEITSFGYRIPHPGQRWAHVDLAPRAATAGLRAADLALLADARAFLRSALALLAGAVLDAETANARAADLEADRQAWELASRVDDGEWVGPGVHPGRVVTTLRRLLPDDAVLTTDAGNFAGWAARGFRFRRPGTFLGPTSGAMGYGLPAAIAASLLGRDRPVVALAGDGGFAMTMAELETAVREGLRVIVLVFDNQSYGTIRMHQEQRGARWARGTTELGPIDFAAIARAMGANGVTVAADPELEPALRAALGADRPTVLHLIVDRRWASVDQHP